MDIKATYKELEQSVRDLKREIIAHKRTGEEAHKARNKVQKINDLLTIIIFSKITGNLFTKANKAAVEVKTLSGIHPICSSCKKIRGGEGDWNQIETYICDHSEAEFSHTVCPECAKKRYPDYYESE